MLNVATAMTLIFLWLTTSASGEAPFDLEYQAREAAYFGEIERLKMLIGDEENLKKFLPYQLNNIVSNAIAGHKVEVITLLVSYGYPHWRQDIAKPFSNPSIDPEITKAFAESIPEFKTKFGPTALATSVKVGHRAIVEYLLKLGVSPNDSDTPALPEALLARNEAMIKLLLAYGADPYQGPTGRSPVDVAVAAKSTQLLKLLDVRKQHASLLAELKRSAPPRKSRLQGLWAHRPAGGGFGEVVMRLFPDGTGLVFNDVGGISVTWNQTSPLSAHIEPAKPSSRTKGATFTVELVAGEKVLQVTDSETKGLIGLILRSEDPSKKPKEKSVHPLFVRLEDAWITSTYLILQIGGRHLVVSLERLVNGTTQSTDGTDISDQNKLPWDDFVQGPPPPNKLVGARKIRIDERRVRADYSPSPGRGRLAFGHSDPVTIGEDDDYVLFPYLYGDTGFALVARQPFAHGKDWIAVQLIKTESNE